MSLTQSAFRKLVSFYSLSVQLGSSTVLFVCLISQATILKDALKGGIRLKEEEIHFACMSEISET